MTGTVTGITNRSDELDPPHRQVRTGIGLEIVERFGTSRAPSGERQFRFEALGHETARTAGDRVIGVDGESACSTSITWGHARC
jgi:hypothetical protein